ncbi:MAG: c-type cytochrome biogenesis protein CcsB [Deltaproteobacteria bacterium]|nr:c-type cytochrome biogenesis protein CcsB [Deltaproteobacteria bacterium]MBM4322138.1 c-type cytochrome biogenesis protein CcsB [Deltaproteobacteria bacterium]MBM4347819.1 c-type cytochrome biogenesis protein CcsB [Deltaproteobacteria bacterium]
MNIHFFKLASLFYLFGTLFYSAYILFLKDSLSKLATIIVTIGFVSHTLALLARYLEAGYTPVTNLYESFSFFAWMIIGILLIANFKYKIKVLGAFLTSIALIFMLFAFALPKEILPLAPVLRSFWHPFHVTFAFLGNAIFTLAFCCGVIYLIQEHQLKSKKMGAIAKRLPSLKVLDDLNYQSLKFGFPLLTLGIITGAVWAEYAWGRYWGWDPKETWSLITWFLYAAMLHQRLTVGWRGRKAAIMAIAGFFAVLFTFLGVNLILPGLHTYSNWKP